MCQHLPATLDVPLLTPVADLAAMVRPRLSAKQHDIAPVDLRRVAACPVRTRQIAAAYLAGPVVEDAARPAYRAFTSETARQFELLTRPSRRGGCGVFVEISQRDPYLDARSMMMDIMAHRRLKVFATGGPGNSHPLLTDEENDMFRAVHDAFGHAAAGRGFDVHGEDAAWFAHCQMYSRLARLAMTTETRGQISTFFWHERGGRFPEQKAMLLPERFCHPGAVSVAAPRPP